MPVRRALQLGIRCVTTASSSWTPTHRGQHKTISNALRIRRHPTNYLHRTEVYSRLFYGPCIRRISISAVLTPPLVFAGLVLTLWTWKCMMMVVFQDKIIYMPNVPPFAKHERMEDYPTPGVDWQLRHIKSIDGTELAVCCGSVSGATPSQDDQLRAPNCRHVVICYFQGNGGSLPPRLPMLSAVLKSVAAQAGNSGARYTLLALSPRGYWESSGRATQSGIELDAQALLNHAVEQYAAPGIDVQLLLWGQSIGSGVATTAAATYLAKFNDAKPTMLGLLLETPFTSIRTMLVAIYPEKWLPYRYLGKFLWNHWDSTAALSKIADAGLRPKILLVAASRDEVVPAEEAHRFEAVCEGLAFDYQRRDILGALHHETTTKGRSVIANFITEVSRRPS